MAQLGHFQTTVQDSSGNALSGVSVTVYREGATFQSGSGTSPVTLTVRNNGKIEDGDTVFINEDTSTTYTVDSGTTDTQIILSGFSGTLSPTAGDRIVPSNNTATLYPDDQGAGTPANPLTTDSNGYASGYCQYAAYDYVLSGGGATTTLKQSYVAPTEALGQVRYADSFADGGTTTGGIQEAIDDLPSTGGTVVLSAATAYTPSSAITGISNVTIRGNGATITSGVNDQLTFTGLSNIRIFDCRFNGDAAYNRILNTETATDVLIRGCYFTNVKTAPTNADNLTTIPAGGSARVTITECEFIDTNSSHCVGLGRSGVADGTDVGAVDFTFTNNRLIRNGSAGDVTGGGIQANPDVSKCARIVVANNLYDTGGRLVQLNGADNVSITGNVCKDTRNAIVVVSFDGSSDTSENVSVTGNVCMGTGGGQSDEAIALLNVDGFAVTGNQVSDAEFGIDIASCTDGVVSGNAVRDITTDTNKIGIVVKRNTTDQASSQIAVTGNIVINAGAVCYRVAGPANDITVSNNTAASSATAGAIGIELTTASAAVTDIHVIGNTVDNIEKGIVARSWTGGSCIGNFVKTTTGRACYIDSLDARTTANLVISGNYFESGATGGGGNEGLRLIDTNADMSAVSIINNTLIGDGTTAMRIEPTSASIAYGNVCVKSTEKFTVVGDTFDFGEFSGVQTVAATPAVLLANTGKLILLSGASTFTLEKAFGQRVLHVFNNSGATRTLTADAGQTIASGATDTIADNTEAIYRYDNATSDWILLYP